jgi:hypothetical protein
MPATVSVAMRNTTGPLECESLEAHCSLEFDEDSMKPDSPEIIDRAFHSAMVACHEALRDDSLRQS